MYEIAVPPPPRKKCFAGESGSARRHSEDDGGPGWVHRVAYSYVDDGRANASAVGEARCPVTRWLGGADSQHRHFDG